MFAGDGLPYGYVRNASGGGNQENLQKAAPI
jgi:hypothetical protein